MDRRTLAVASTVAFGSALMRPARAQTVEGTRALAERFAATLTAHDMAGFAALFADDYRNHQVSAAAPAPPPGLTQKQATVNFFAARLAGIPDLKVAIEVVVPTVNKVAASFVYTGTHDGIYFGVAPTGKALRFTSCDIFAIHAGAFIEHWGMGDIAGTLTQLKS
jgi:predicted SnoaL-like aldol condensation-catalyzing enzyme